MTYRHCSYEKYAKFSSSAEPKHVDYGATVRKCGSLTLTNNKIYGISWNLAILTRRE